MSLLKDMTRLLGSAEGARERLHEDLLTSTRPYRRGMPVEKALAIIEENPARQFDRDFGQRFVAMGHAGQLDHIVGHSDEGIPLRECVMCGPTLVLKKGQAPANMSPKGAPANSLPCQPAARERRAIWNPPPTPN